MLQIGLGLAKLHESDQRMKDAFSSEIQGFQPTELIGPDVNYINCFWQPAWEIW